jgi:multidrug efflux pump
VRIAQVPEFLIMGVTIGVLPLLAYSYGKGDRERLTSALRASAITVAGVMLVFGTTVFVFREPIFAAFSANHSVLAIGVVVLTAQLISALFNGFSGLLTSLFQATGRSLQSIIMSVGQGIAFIPIVIFANIWFGLAGIIWSLTVSEGIVFLVGIVMWLASRASIGRGLAEGSPERAEEVLEQE